MFGARSAEARLRPGTGAAPSAGPAAASAATLRPRTSSTALRWCSRRGGVCLPCACWPPDLRRTGHSRSRGKACTRLFAVVVRGCVAAGRLVEGNVGGQQRRWWCRCVVVWLCGVGRCVEWWRQRPRTGGRWINGSDDSQPAVTSIRSHRIGTLAHSPQGGQHLHSFPNARPASVFLSQCTASICIPLLMHGQHLYSSPNARPASAFLPQCTASICILPQCAASICTPPPQRTKVMPYQTSQAPDPIHCMLSRSSGHPRGRGRSAFSPTDRRKPSRPPRHPGPRQT